MTGYGFSYMFVIYFVVFWTYRITHEDEPTAQNRSCPRKTRKRRRQKMRALSSSSSTSSRSSPSPQTPKRKPIPRKAEHCSTSSCTSLDESTTDSSSESSSSYFTSEESGDEPELDRTLPLSVKSPFPMMCGENPGSGAEGLSSVPEPGPSQAKQRPSVKSVPLGESFQIPGTGNERFGNILEPGEYFLAAPGATDSDMVQFPAIIPAQVYQNGLGNGNLNPVMVPAQEQDESMHVNLASHSYSVSAASVTPRASLRGPTIINFPLPPICFTEADRM